MKLLHVHKSGKNGVLRYIIGYTMSFLIVSLLVFYSFIVYDKTFIYGGDGRYQYSVVVLYFGRFLRNIFSGLFLEHRLVFPEFDFSIGYGTPILPSTIWQLIGDPLYYLSVIANENNFELVYHLIVILRLYFTGLMFSVFSLYTNKNRQFETLICSLLYVFSGFSMYTTVRQQVFINPMFYFPLVLFALELMIKENKRWQFAIAVSWCITNSFYFAYMIGMFTVAYALLRYYIVYGKPRRDRVVAFFSPILKYGMIGVLMASAYLIPVFLFFSKGMRSTVRIDYPFLYSIKYYINLIVNILTSVQAGSYSFSCMSILAFIGILLAFGINTKDLPELKRRKVVTIRFVFLVFLMMMVFPFFGSLLNGLNYVTNRWIWAYVLFVSYLPICLSEDYLKPTNRQMQYVQVGTIVYLILLFIIQIPIEINTLENTFACTILLLLVAFILFANHHALLSNKNHIVHILGVLAMVQIVLNAYYLYHPRNQNYIDEGHDVGKVLESHDTSYTVAMGQIISEADDLFIPRYETDRYTDANWDMIDQAYGIQFYWSMSNGRISKFLLENAFGNWRSYNYKGLDKRTILDSLASVNYYITSKNNVNNTITYGFDFAVDMESFGFPYLLYKNRFGLPIGYLYNNLIDKEYYDSIPAYKKQQALLQGAVIDDDSFTSPDNSFIMPEYSDVSIDYSIQLSDGLILLDTNKYMAIKSGTSLTLTFEGLPNCETYLYFEGLDNEYMTSYQLYKDEIDRVFSKSSYNSLPFKRRLRYIIQNFTLNKWDGRVKTATCTITSGNDETMLLHRSSYDEYYVGQDTYLMNLGYSEEARNAIRIELPYPGIFKFNNMKIICQPMDDYTNYIEKLGQNTLEVSSVGVDYIKGTINTDKEGILLLTIPFDNGWTAYLDGKQSTIYPANTMFSCIEVEEGVHSIELLYHTPGLRIGIIITCIGIVLLIISLILDGKYKVNDTNKEITR